MPVLTNSVVCNVRARWKLFSLPLHICMSAVSRSCSLAIALEARPFIRSNSFISYLRGYDFDISGDAGVIAHVVVGQRDRVVSARPVLEWLREHAAPSLRAFNNAIFAVAHSLLMSGAHPSHQCPSVRTK